MKFAVKSDKGLVREKNEDSYNIVSGDQDLPLTFIIADGMGGHNAGEIASSMAVDFLSAEVLRYAVDFSDEDNLQDRIIELIHGANTKIFECSKENAENYGMGTTLILAMVLGNKLLIAHIGDSRVYLLRDKEIKQVTTDHSYIEELVRSGTLSREEAQNHPQKNVITRALGCTEDIEIDYYTYEICKSDSFVICTDGLTNMLGDSEIAEIINNSPDPEAACDELVRMANEKGGEDNITVVVFRKE